MNFEWLVSYEWTVAGKEPWLASKETLHSEAAVTALCTSLSKQPLGVGVRNLTIQRRVVGDWEIVTL